VQAELARLTAGDVGSCAQAAARLVDAAADTLGAVMADPESPAARVSAARTVIAQALRLDDRIELEERLVRVEQSIEAQ
jgi:hypothetical protein